MYKLKQDDDCHWYMIREEHEMLFNGLITQGMHDTFNSIFSKYRLQGGPETLRFVEPVIDGIVGDDMPKTKDGVRVYAGMPLYRDGMDDTILECHVDVRAYWIDSEGHHFTDSVSNYYAEPTG
jgi:hypothetical protein